MAIKICDTWIDQHGRELIEHGTTAFPIGCYHDHLEHGPFPWHWHDELEITVVESGAVDVYIGTEKFHVRAGEGYFVNAGVLHAGWQCGDVPCYLQNLVFHPRLVGGDTDSVFWQKYVQPVLADTTMQGVYFDGKTAKSREAILAIRRAWELCVHETPGYEIQVRSELSHLVYLLSQRNSDMEAAPSEKKIRDEERIKVMLQHIHDNYSETLTVERIAKSAAISESECLRCFRGMIGTTPIRYVNQYRIQKAAELLSETELKISDIGVQCGFQEMSYFARIFRQTIGCTPGEYRQRAKQSRGSVRERAAE